jgi:MYXO-CTERM domain-containing protein
MAKLHLAMAAAATMMTVTVAPAWAQGATPTTAAPTAEIDDDDDGDEGKLGLLGLLGLAGLLGLKRRDHRHDDTTRR